MTTVNKLNPYTEARVRRHLIEGLTRGYALRNVIHFCKPNSDGVWQSQKISFPCRARWLDRIFYPDSYMTASPKTVLESSEKEKVVA